MKKLDQRGQGMTEYIILVALIAIAAIAAVKIFGKKTSDGFENAAQAVGTATSGNGAADAAGNAAKDVANAAINKGIDKITKK